MWFMFHTNSDAGILCANKEGKKELSELCRCALNHRLELRGDDITDLGAMQKSVQCEHFDLNALVELKTDLKRSTKLSRHFISTPLGSSINDWCTMRIAFLQKHKWHFESLAKIVREISSETFSNVMKGGKLLNMVATLTKIGKELGAVLEHMEEKSGIAAEVRSIQDALKGGFKTVVIHRSTEFNNAVGALLKEPIQKLTASKEAAVTEDNANKYHSALLAGLDQLTKAESEAPSIEAFADDEQKQWWLIQKQSLRAILSGLRWVVPLRFPKHLPDEVPSSEDFGDVMRIITDFKSVESLKMVLRVDGKFTDAELKSKTTMVGLWNTVVKVQADGLHFVFNSHKKDLLQDPQVSTCLLVLRKFWREHCLREETSAAGKPVDPIDLFALPDLLNKKLLDIQFATLEEFKSRSSSLAEMAGALDNEYLGNVAWPQEDRLASDVELKPSLPVMQMEWLPAVFSFGAGLQAVLICRRRIASQDFSMFNVTAADDDEEAGAESNTPNYSEVANTMRKLLAMVRSRQLSALSMIGTLPTDSCNIKAMLQVLADAFGGVCKEIVQWAASTSSLLTPFVKRNKDTMDKLLQQDCFADLKKVRSTYKSSDGTSLFTTVNILRTAHGNYVEMLKTMNIPTAGALPDAAAVLQSGLDIMAVFGVAQAGLIAWSCC